MIIENGPMSTSIKEKRFKSLTDRLIAYGADGAAALIEFYQNLDDSKPRPLLSGSAREGIERIRDERDELPLQMRNSLERFLVALKSTGRDLDELFEMSRVPDTVAEIKIVLERVAPKLHNVIKRTEAALPYGLTLAEIVRKALPNSTNSDLIQVRVELSARQVGDVILPEYWYMVRPRRGARVVIRTYASEFSNPMYSVYKPQPRQRGEAVPAKAPPLGNRLDSARISSIREETERVSLVLGAIFSVDADEEEVTTQVNSTMLAGLDKKHSGLVRVIVTRQHWSKGDFAELVACHDLLVAGALETVNEWSFQVHDEVLLDEYDGYDVTPEIADTIKQELSKEGAHVQTETT